jgi:protein-disulfide isomerase
MYSRVIYGETIMSRLGRRFSFRLGLFAAALFVALGLAGTMASSPAQAQTATEGAAAGTAGDISELRGEIEALRREQAAIRQRLDVIIQLLRGRGQRGGSAAATTELPGEVVLSAAGAAVLGDADAKVAILEFSDYQCPFCGRHSQATLPQLVKDYVATGKIKYVLRDFPIESIHPAAFEAAVAARCAGEQGKYMEMHDRFFAMRNSLPAKDWTGHARAVGLDMDAFGACMDSKRFEAAVRADMAEAAKIGLRGTPTFFVGVVSEDGESVTATRVIRGAQPYAAFKQVLDALLAQAAG